MSRAAVLPALAALLTPDSAGNVLLGTSPAQFDSSSKLATTGFVQRAIGNFQTIASLAAATTLSAAQAGAAYTLNPGASITLPTYASVPRGSSFAFINAATAPTTISAQGTDLMFGPQGPNQGFTGTATSFTLLPGDWCVMTAMVQWEMVSGSPLMQINAGRFTASLAASGYQKLPSGLIIEWGTVNTSPSGSSVSFPMAFPTACFAVTLGQYSTAIPANCYTAMNGVPSTTGFTISSNAAPPPVFWTAIGH